MSSRVCVTGHIKDPVSLFEKRRASCPILCSRPEDGLRCRQRVKPPLRPQTVDIVSVDFGVGVIGRVESDACVSH